MTVEDSAGAAPGGGAPVSERRLGDLWRRADTLPDGLVTEDGRRLRVLYPGRPSSRSGPDFVDAVLADEDGARIVGDVELHLRAPDWYHHRHADDPGYNAVVLHVVMSPRGHASSRQQSGIRVPVASVAHLVPDLQPGREDRTPAAPERDPGEELDRAGDRRFLLKSRGFAEELGWARRTPDQTLYRALMESLGYSANRRLFLELSDRVPFDLLSTLRGEPEGTRTLAIKAMLMRGAGLLGRAARCGESRQMRAVLGRLPKTGSVAPDRWRLFRVRPTNHPVNRIAGAAGLLSRYLESGLVVGMRSEAESSEGRAYLASLAVPPFIGVGRAGEMAVNAVLPFLHAYAGARRDPELAGRSIDVYHGLPKLEENEVTREMRRRLFPDGHAPRLNARRQQGLLHRYKRMTAGPPTALFERPGPPTLSATPAGR